MIQMTGSREALCFLIVLDCKEQSVIKWLGQRITDKISERRKL